MHKKAKRKAIRYPDNSFGRVFKPLEKEPLARKKKVSKKEEDALTARLRKAAVKANPILMKVPGFEHEFRQTEKLLKQSWTTYESALTDWDSPLWLPNLEGLTVDRLKVIDASEVGIYLLGMACRVDCRVNNVPVNASMALAKMPGEGRCRDFAGQIGHYQGLVLKNWDAVAFWRKILRQYFYGWPVFEFPESRSKKAIGENVACTGIALAREMCFAFFRATFTPPPMRCPSGAKLSFDAPLLLGVLNVTPDSFSDGGRFLDPHAAVRRAREMVREGAHALDLGAESTRPGAKPVSAKEQKRRLLPVIREIRREKALRKIPLSIDTQSAEVLRACLGEGADILNDISALRADRAMAKTAARAKCPVILMHMQGTPRTMQKDPKYVDVVDEIDLFFRKRIHAAYDAGIAPTNVVLDPGIGFGKTLEHNVEILRRLRELKALGRPLLIGVSRKSMLGKLSGEPVAEQRLPESLAAGSIALAHGAAILRVHDVAEHARAIKVAAPLVDAPIRPVRASTRRQKGR